MNLRVSPRARADLDRLIDWLAERSPNAARKATREVLDALEMIQSYPEVGRRVRGSLREKVIGFGRDGFIARYRIGPEGVIVVRVYHGRQRR